MNAFFDHTFVGILELGSIGSEHLDAVILIRIVRRRDHQTSRVSEPFRQKRDRRCWDDAGVLQRCRRMSEPFLKKFENPRAGYSGVLADKNFSAELFAYCPAD